MQCPLYFTFHFSARAQSLFTQGLSSGELGLETDRYVSLNEIKKKTSSLISTGKALTGLAAAMWKLPSWICDDALFSGYGHTVGSFFRQSPTYPTTLGLIIPRRRTDHPRRTYHPQ
jgi:hypothetical protein